MWDTEPSAQFRQVLDPTVLFSYLVLSMDWTNKFTAHFVHYEVLIEISISYK